MSGILHSAHLTHKALESLKHAKTPASGALSGAIAAGGGVAGSLALAGLALTPLGWAVTLGTGAVLGARHISKKLNNS